MVLQSESEKASGLGTERLAIALLAGAGAVETAAISASKLFGDGNVEALCITGGACSDVLNGPWASVAGVPLAALGALSYATVLALAIAPLARTDQAADVSATVNSALLGLTAAMASFSACLMLLLATVIRLPCSLCIGSALLSGSMFAAAWKSSMVPGRTDAFVVSVSAALVSVAAAGLLYVLQPDDAFDGDAMGPQSPPAIRSKSSTEALTVAKRMEAYGGRMFGAYWCSHCINQKEILGREVFTGTPAVLQYIECDADGANSQKEICQEEGIKGYPTWQLNGKLFSGEKDVTELAELLDKLDAEAR